MLEESLWSRVVGFLRWLGERLGLTGAIPGPVLDGPEPPRPEPWNLPPLEQARRAPPRPINQVRICVDFGTSACAVALAMDKTAYDLANFAINLRDGTKPQYTIDSIFAVPRRGHEGAAIIGQPAIGLDESSSYELYRSLKRFLSDGPGTDNVRPQVQRALTKVIEELLTMAMVPKNSATVAEVCRRNQQRPIGQLVANMGLDKLPSPKDIKTRGIMLYMSVPNSFGSYESGLIRDAGKAALARVLASIGLAKLKVAHPKMIREAEAVLWHEISLGRMPKTEEPQRWLVFDVGGGSTDAAVVELKRGLHFSVRTVKHSGVTFGGNEVDELFLKSLAERHGTRQGTQEEAVEAITRQFHHNGIRRTALREIKAEKENWSVNLGEQLDLPGPVEGDAERKATPAEQWLNWIVDVVTPDRDPNVIPPSLVTARQGSIRFRNQAGDRPDELGLEHQDYSRRLALFYRSTINTIIDDLFPLGRAGEVPLERVVLSGRGSMLPGYREALELYLQSRGLLGDGVQVDTVTRFQEDDPDFMKLACVRGSCRATFSGGVDAVVSDILSQEVICKVGDEPDPMVIWPSGTRLLPGGDARARIEIPATHHVLGFWVHQRRFPLAIERYLERSSSWGERTLVGVEFDPWESDRHIRVVFRASEWRAVIWDQDEPFVMVPGEPPDPLNPITGLTFTWADG